MKELTIEEKAKRYDEAKARMSKAYNSNRCTIGFMNEIFPEFKDEDERIKEEIINYFECQSRDEPCRKAIHDKWIAWLEKQGQTFTKEDTDNANKVEPKDYYSIDPHFGKPVDKVKPKFHEGDWVVSPNGVYWHIDRIENNHYEVTSNTGESSNWPLDTNIYHRFTIQDAKKGDILACGKCILIFDQLSEFNNEKVLMDICHCTSKGFYWQDTKDRDVWALDGFKPATKEQCGILFAKMHEAGYEWDTDKKELKKIENEIEIPFGAKDSELQEVSYYIPEGFYAEIDDDGVIIKKGKKPSAWSGEDNTYYDDICEILINLIHSETAKVNKDVVQKDLDWLMSIKQRIIE